MSQIELKFDSEQNAFGLTEDFDDLYIPKKASRLPLIDCFNVLLFVNLCIYICINIDIHMYIHFRV